jgi:hypothetical protein
MTTLSLTWGLGLIELAFRCDDIYSSEQWAATGREGCMRFLAFYEDILKAKKRSVSHWTSVLDFFKSSWGPCASSCCWILEMMIQNIHLQFIWNGLILT